MRRGRALGTVVGALGLLVAGGGATGCFDVGNSPVRGGTSALDFGLFEVPPSGGGEAPIVRLQLFLASPYFHWDFRDRALIGNRLTSAQTEFDLTQVSLGLRPFVQYTSDHAYWEQLTDRLEISRQHEVVLFARDPQEMSRLHRGLVGPLDYQNPSAVPPRWRDEWRGERIPDARTMWYPPQKGWDTVWDNNDLPRLLVGLHDPSQPPQPVLARLERHHFWGGNAPEGPGALPEGEGSIKAAKVYDHGLCGQELPFVTGNPNAPGLLEQIAKLVPEFVAKSVIERFPLGYVERNWLHVAPYLDFTTPKEDAQLGGFFLNMNMQLRVIAGGGPNVVMHGAHALQLLDGRLTVAGESLYTGGQGTGAGDFMLEAGPTLYRVLDGPLRPRDAAKTMAEAIFQVADNLQAWRGIAALLPDVNDPTRPIVQVREDCLSGPHFSACGHCVERAAGDDRVEARPGGECDPFINGPAGLRLGLDAAMANLGGPLGLTAEERAQLRDETMLGTVLVGGTPVYKNIRCAAAPGGDPNVPAQGVCEYKLPAKRLHVLPDAVKLVFLDERKEIANPLYPIWLTVLDIAQTTPSAYPGLCGGFRAQVPGTTFARSFTAVNRDFLRYRCDDNSFNIIDGCTKIIEETGP